ncbi:MAG TPA: autotransporter domain-containing protein [Xanthobacteraceae bacterium]|nr:autotransporter domain-containing protein [Xanthobacteraceae bacterium]
MTGSSGAIGNAASIDCITIHGATVNGNVNNTGTLNLISTGVAISGSTIHGAVNDTGAILGGIRVSGDSTIRAINTAVRVVSTSTFGGGINNSGTISSSNANGIELESISTFSGGITNSGAISAQAFGLAVVASGTVSGGITNSGTISSAHGFGIFVSTVAQFGANAAGGITNSGTIAGHTTAIYIDLVSTFAGGITNSGVVSAPVGIVVSGSGGGGSIVTSLFSGAISNSGTIAAVHAGIVVTGVGQFGDSAGGGITNSGSITVGRSGEAIVVGNVSNFTGGISNSGMITVGRSGVGIDTASISTFSGGITNSGTIKVGASGAGVVVDAVSFFGNVSNSGTITGAHTGIFICGCVTFQGGAIVNTGTIAGVLGILTEPGSGPVSVFDSGTIIGTGGKAVDLSGGSVGSTFTLGAGYNITGLVLGQNGDTLQLGGTGTASFDLSNVIDTIASGSSGHLPQYQGFDIFNVVSGTWTTTGTFSGTEAWNVNGGTLAGTGTFADVNVNSGGTLEPGLIGTPGTFMTVNGNLALQSGALYLVNLNSTTASRVNVAGTASLAGTVTAAVTGSTSNQPYDILHAGNVTGTFSGFSGLNNYAGTLTYTPTDVFLNLTANLGGGMARNSNQRNVATTINNFFNAGGTLPAGFSSLFGLTGGGLGNALTQVSGEAATDADKGAFQLMNDFLNLMLDPTAGGGGNVSGGANGFAPEQDATLPPDIAEAYAGVLKAQPAKQTFDQRWTAWGSGFGGTSFTNGNAAIGSNNVKASDYGFAAGMEYHLTPDTVYGFALAGGGTNWNLAQGLGSGRSDAFQAGVYGKTHWGPAYVSAALAFANHWFTTDRIAQSDQLRASFTGQSYAARLEGGYRYALPITGAIVGVTPYAAVQAQDFHTPSYSETDITGGGFGLSYASMNATDTRSELGARFDNLQIVDSMPLVLRGRLAWAHDWFTNAAALNAVFQTLPGSSFTVDGAAPPKNSALTTAAAELHITSNWTAIAKFDGEFGSGSQTYGGTGTLRYSW